jgi:hypothetical protein
MNEELINLLKHRIAEGAIGPSALRNQGDSGVLSAARRFLKSINLIEFSVNSERKFKTVLDAHTNRLKRSFPKEARHWGAARKGLNLFLRDVLYNRYLSRYYGFRGVERWLEIPLDSYTAKAIRRRYGAKGLPPWRGIKHLKPEVSQAYQDAATRLASDCGFARVHLDILYWREVGRKALPRDPKPRADKREPR